MALEQKLSLKLSQRLVMTPSLQQAIKLLQMTRLELEGVVTEELTENPMLEQMEDADEEADRGVDQEPTAETDSGDDGESSEAADGAVKDDPVEDSPTQDDKVEGEEAAEAEDPQSLDDIDIDAYFNDYLDGAGSTAASTFELRDAAPLENTVSATPELADHLLWQIHMMDLKPIQRELAEVVIGNLNEDGFLRATVEEIQLIAASVEEREAYRSALAKRKADSRDAEATDAGAEDAVRTESDSETSAMPGPRGGDLANAQTREPAGLAELARLSAAAAPQAQRRATVGASEPPGPVAELASVESSVRSSRSLPDPPDFPAAEPTVPGYRREAVEEAIALVQSLDPPGVGATDLRQSLLLQLAAAGESESLAYELIEDDWDRLLKRQFAAIAKSLGRPLAELEEPFERIRQLDTRPGRRFGGTGAQYVEPDVAVLKVGGEYVIQINDDGMPRLRVSKAYRQMLQKMRAEGRESEAQQFLRDKMRSAIWLIKSLDQRQRTIYKVATSIVKQQRGFLDAGVEHLRPMVLRDVAEDIGMHESTVSRVVSNKYIHTPRGLFPMKFFFHSGIDSDQGEDISSLSVKRKLRHFIEGENPKKPLSDSALMRRLNAEGINIARRTVAKYRDELNIPSSTDRKQVF